MITNLKDDAGKIIAYCEWRLVGPSGYEAPNADHIWVNAIWVHDDYRHLNKIGMIIDEIMANTPQAMFGYFSRGKYGDRMKMFTREQWERRRTSCDVI